jgi:hypothetical protein
MDKDHVPFSEADQLADFTDRLLAGEQPAGAAAPSGNRDLFQLQAAVRAIQENLPAQPPDTALSNRIRARLSAEWSANGPQVRQAPIAWRPARRAIAAWTVGIVAVLVLAGAFLFSRLPALTPGAAQARGGALGIVLVALAIIAIIFWWRRKKP